VRQWFTSEVHVSWRLVALAAGVIVGTAGSLVSPAVLGDDLFAVIACTAGFLAMMWRYRWVAVAAFLAGALFGAWRGTGQQELLRLYEPYLGQVVTLRGVLHEDAALGAHGDQRLVLGHVAIAGQDLPGETWISSTKADVKRGDVITVRGKLEQGFGTFPATMYRAGINTIQRPRPGDVARVIRDGFAAAVRLGVAEPNASLGVGFLTGQRSTLPADLDEQLRVVGLTHAVVASGYNLTILVAFARSALQRFSKYLATMAAGGMVLAFMGITGLSPSMSRAGLVAGLGLLAWYYGRSLHPFVLLPVAAAVTLIVRPSYVWGDIGWYLSFLAFAGVIVLGPLLRRYFWEPGHNPPAVIQLVIDTIAAQAATLPIILFCFGQFATYALLANLLVLPLVPLAMVLTFAAGLGGLLMPGIAAVIGLPAQWLLGYMVWVVGTVADLPGAQEEISFGGGWLVAGYLILSLLSLYLWRKTGLDFRADSDIAKTI